VRVTYSALFPRFRAGSLQLRPAFIVQSLFAFLLSVFSPLLAGQPAHLVKDLTTTVTKLGSSPNNFVDVGGIVFFTASDDANRKELWRTDGTEGGTRLVRDIVLGPNDVPSVPPPACLQQFGGKLVLLGTEESTGTQLWESNGTTAGTTLLIKLVGTSGMGGISIDACPVNVTGTLFFNVREAVALSGTSLSGLWKTDGTTAGTIRIGQWRVSPPESHCREWHAFLQRGYVRFGTRAVESRWHHRRHHSGQGY
jgi:ELWxxDGT repeat protein